MNTEGNKTKSNFLGLADDDSRYRESKYVILPVGYEKTTSFGKGTAGAPHSIIAASHEVELYDDELRCEPYRAGIHTLPEPDVASLNPEAVVERISEMVTQLDDDGKFVITLGGEHTVAIGPAMAHARRQTNLSVLQIDAHADLRESYQSSRYSHACTMRRIRDCVSTTVGIGIRNISAEEVRYVEKEKLRLFFAQDIVRRDNWHDEALNCLTENVYLTIDLDGFDPSVIPGVGTPEPGGLGWYETLRFLKKLCETRNVVGFDVVELMPIPGNLVSEFTAAKLIYRLIGYLE